MSLGLSKIFTPNEVTLNRKKLSEKIQLGSLLSPFPVYGNGGFGAPAGQV